MEPGRLPLTDQRDLYVEILREGFEVSPEDDVGLDIEVHSDFLLSGLNVAISNVATGQVVEDERRDSSSQLLVGRLLPGAYELIVYTHQCVTNMDQEVAPALTGFDLLLTMSVRLLRVQALGEAGAGRTPVAVEILDYAQGGYGGAQPRVKDSSNAAPFVVPAEEFRCRKEYMPLPTSLDSLS